MPYIKQEDREKFAKAIENALDAFGFDWSCGEFNYFVSSIAVNLFERNKRYQTANDLLGALDGVSREFYRLQVAPYEDEKLEENGDVEVLPLEISFDSAQDFMVKGYHNHSDQEKKLFFEALVGEEKAGKLLDYFKKKESEDLKSREDYYIYLSKTQDLKSDIEQGQEFVETLEKLNFKARHMVLGNYGNGLCVKAVDLDEDYAKTLKRFSIVEKVEKISAEKNMDELKSDLATANSELMESIDNGEDTLEKSQKREDCHNAVYNKLVEELGEENILKKYANEN